MRHLSTARTALSMTPVAMHFDLRRRDVFDRVLNIFARVVERSATLGTGVAPQIVNDVVRTRLNRRSHHAGMLSLSLRPTILVLLRPRNRVRLRPKPLLPPLQLDRQLGDLRLEFRDPNVTLRQRRLRPRQLRLQTRHASQHRLKLLPKILHDPPTLASTPR